MKKLLAIVLSTIAFSAMAKENITVVYSWAPADVAANFHRQIVEEANRIQDKYNFIFDSKPGAGGAVAARYVQNTSNTILATSSAFFIRPNFFPKESHDIDKFRMLLPVCSAPIVISSKKYKSWKEVPTDRPLTIGVSGIGITTHLVATEVAKNYPQLIVVPFKSTSEALVSMLGGSTDFAVTFMGDIEQYKNTSDSKTRVYPLGITGNKTVAGVAPLSSQGFPKISEAMSSPAQELAPALMPEEKFKEIRAILFTAAKAKTVKDAMAVDYCQSLNDMPDNQIDPWFNVQRARWKNIASGITLK
jgi:tripartite-type tricarboxylate transporter receptor subunit TctC